MRGHDWILFALMIFLSFEVTQTYHIKQLYALSNQKIMLNAYLDTAVESAAYGNFSVEDGKIIWDRDAVADYFFEETGRLLNLSEKDFPVFLIRQEEEVYFYSDGVWHSIMLVSDEEKNSIILKETIESLIGHSIVSQNNHLIPNVFLPAEKQNHYSNPIGEYGIFAVMQVRSTFLSDSNIYIVSGCGVFGAII